MVQNFAAVLKLQYSCDTMIGRLKNLRRKVMLKALKKNLWSVICAFWALVVALFWTAMRVIWSGISKVIAIALIVVISIAINKKLNKKKC